MQFIASRSCTQNPTKVKNRSAAASLLPLIAAAAVLSLSAAQLCAQGCILARSPESGGMPTGQGGTLEPGHFQITIGERHQYSYQHFVGDVYQEYRAQAMNQVQNRINLITTNLTYQWTPKISFDIDMPWLFASRKSQNSPIKYEAQGLGDTIIGVNYWIRNPEHGPSNNFSVGGGVLIPTGNDDVENTVNTNTTGTGAAVEVTAPVDYSIQPGNGGWGLVMQWAGYSRVGKSLVFYTDGDYLATQGGTNGIQRGATLSTTTPLENYVAISDQYLLEAGVSFPVSHVKGLNATFGPRDEGVPAKNLFPNNNDGFRRPGYAVTAGPGGEYTRGSNILTAGIFKAVHRDRTSSVPDAVYGTHGDAAFAQWVWLASVTHRF
jgi:hypothetical protein